MYEEIKDKVLKGIKRSLEKLKEQSKKEGRTLIVTVKKTLSSIKLM